jgi:ABC-type dipeptide/oligopeptide/nickel transport system permease component
MLQYSLRRILISILILLLVLTLVFIVVRVLPGEPAISVLGNQASKEAVEALRIRMGLCDPLWLQYLKFIENLCIGDLGPSIINGVPGADQIGSVIPYTLELTFLAVLLGYLFGIPLRISAAVRRNSLVDYFNRVFSLLGLSVPAFYLPIIIILVFSVQLRLLPVVGGGEFLSLEDNFRHDALPALALGLMMTAYVTRMTRSSILDIMREDYVRTAHSKGLSEGKVL